MLAEKIILSTRDAVMVLDDFIKTLPPDFELTTEGSVCAVFLYLADKEASACDVSEYLSNLEEELMTSTKSHYYISKLCDHLGDVAAMMWTEMVRWGIFTHSGTNWYHPDRLLNFDLVIELMQDKETIMEDLMGEEVQ